ncbi:MAG: hypothetical protein Q9M17_04705 [Mariprofundus sp.]|nr:hypothetical protein [Mariprofundus sp.]
MKKIIATAAITLASVGFACNANAQEISYYTGVGVGILSTEHKAAGVDQTKKTFGGFVKFGADFDYKLDNNLSIGADWTQYMFPVSMKAGIVFAADSKARMWGLTTNVAYHF